jgi:uncharacterized protein (DUF983 family)
MASPAAITMVARALTRRCPHCGSGGLFHGWFRARERCPRCGLRLLRGDEGYAVGTYLFNLVVAELVLFAVMAAVIVATWPDPPWDLLQRWSLVLMVAAPLAFYPFARLLFLAFDLAFRPVRPEELGPTA